MRQAERILTGFGGTAPSRATVHEPTRADDVCRLLGGSPKRGVIARGLGRSYGDAAQNGGGAVLAMRSLRRVLSLDAAERRVVVEAGISLGELFSLLAPLGLAVPIAPGTRFVTVGGAIASDVHGKDHARRGGFSRCVESFTLAVPGGDRVIVTRQSPPGAFAATIGGMGLTGVVLEATLSLRPLPGVVVRQARVRLDDLPAVITRLEQAARDTTYAAAWLDLSRAKGPTRGFVLSADEATETGAAAPTPDAWASRHGRRIRRSRLPVAAPSGLVRRATVRVFNEALLRRLGRETSPIVPLISVLFPLDGVPGWERLYGRRGLVQYQFVVPHDQTEALFEIVTQMCRGRQPLALASLRRLSGGEGLLGFPLPGWSLAVDLPAARLGLTRFLDELDRSVAAAGGRVYLAKDARLRPDRLREMYRDLDRFQSVRRTLDPDGHMCSDLGRRLALVG